MPQRRTNIWDWAITTGDCTLKNADSQFAVDAASEHTVTVKTDKAYSVVATNYYDTLTVSLTINAQAVTVKVPLMQASLKGNDLVWSVMHNGTRYFIMGNQTGLIYRTYLIADGTIYKTGTRNPVEYGSKDATNSDAGYIGCWDYDFDATTSTLTSLTLPAPINKKFAISGSTPTVGDSETELTYHIINRYIDSNSNYEEQVKLQYGATQYLQFDGTELVLVSDVDEASIFSLSYPIKEYSLLNNGAYPDHGYAEFGYNSTSPITIQTLYKAARSRTALFDNELLHLTYVEETNVSNLKNASGEWRVDYTINKIADSRTGDASGLGISTNATTLVTTITPAGDSPSGDIDITDTLNVCLRLLTGHPTYRFGGAWSSYSDTSQMHLKIPLIRKAYHSQNYDEVMCIETQDQVVHTFPASEAAGTTFTFVLTTQRTTGTRVYDLDGHIVSETATIGTLTEGMDLTDAGMAELRLIDEYGNAPSWCEISATTDSTITVRCKENGIRSPRLAYIYLAYIVKANNATDYRYINFRLQISQQSLFDYGSNQTLIHTNGVTGEPTESNGMQQVHENRRILYYYPDQKIELPLRERGFFGWWRWYNYETDEDIPDTRWQTAPRNTGRYSFPFNTIGEKVPIVPEDPESDSILVTQGRYTIFHYPSRSYVDRNDPPSKTPLLNPRLDKGVDVIAVDISNYYDNLPLSVKEINQVDADYLDTMQHILEPTLSLREIFELRPWTEMAEKMEDYKTRIADGFASDEYMEDHIVRAPIGSRLLLGTEQRYNYTNLARKGHSESLLCYYMRDDNWNTETNGGWTDGRKDSMIWCAGWDVDAKWYTFNPSTNTYTICNFTVTEEQDFLSVPAKSAITAGQTYDTVYYCLRAQSKKTTGGKKEGYNTPPANDTEETTVDGDYFFNICRYKIIYHNAKLYGPLQETTSKGVTKALLTDEEIEQTYEVLERLNFDYNHPGNDYHVYPHPLPWADASYGYCYGEEMNIPDNRYHEQRYLPGNGEYGIINKIPFTTYWRTMEQHGGAANGYMIYCDGMSAAGQVAALTLDTTLCTGQKMYLSAYVGNPSNQSNKALPNFRFNIQGRDNLGSWHNLTSYMTGEINPSDKWYQIYFPIEIPSGVEYEHFRIEVFNYASDYDGNDFVIDDICIFATKPPLMVYQADTHCSADANDSIVNMLIRLDYQGITSDGYNDAKIYYTVNRIKGTDTTFVKMEDGYINNEVTAHTSGNHAKDTICGYIDMPTKSYTPAADNDSIYPNITALIEAYDESDQAKRVGYIFETIEGVERPVMYIVHTAKMTPDNQYLVRMSLSRAELTSSICALTSPLKISNRMMLEVNGTEQPSRQIYDICGNTTYDISLRVKATVMNESSPIDVNGSCYNDWLLDGDTIAATSKARYGYYYSDIVQVLRYILRNTDERNTNRFAQNLGEISRSNLINVRDNIMGYTASSFREGTLIDPYQMIADLVHDGYLTLYRSNMLTIVPSGDSLQYIVLPIEGTGSENVQAMNIEVCSQPLFIKLKPKASSYTALELGGLRRTDTESKNPIVVLTDATGAQTRIDIPIDSIRSTQVVIDSIILYSTTDPNFLPGIHRLHLIPDRQYNFSGGSNDGYYKSHDILRLTPSSSNNYTMLEGYDYSFRITLQTTLGAKIAAGCPIGNTLFTLSIVPSHLRWAPQSEDSNDWNAAYNWLAIDNYGNPIPNSHYVPKEHTDVIIPTLGEGTPYPTLPNAIATTDSVRQLGFVYNQCNNIRFMKDAVIGGPKNLTYDNAIVDFTLPTDKWTLASSPVENMYSGDLFVALADQSGSSSDWEVAEFDGNGRNGNASFWLSLYSTSVLRKGNVGGTSDTLVDASANWSRITNALSQPLPTATGWAVYSRTKDAQQPIVRLPKEDTRYFYYDVYGNKMENLYEDVSRASRQGKLAYDKDKNTGYTITNGVTGTTFVFGNPTMAYIDIWGFIADNAGVAEEFKYFNDEGNDLISVTKATALATANTISQSQRYLAPMRAIVLTASSGLSFSPVLNTNRVVIAPVDQSSPAPARSQATSWEEDTPAGLMTITAINPVSTRCVSRLILGQGYHNDIRNGEDAVLMTMNIDNFSLTGAPTTPFNIYSVCNHFGMSIDLRHHLTNVPVSFVMSDLPYAPNTTLWFTGVNAISDTIYWYDDLEKTYTRIIDGMSITIPTPAANDERRYYIRNSMSAPSAYDDTPTTIEYTDSVDTEQRVQKIFVNGQIYIIKGKQVYSVLGQQL